MEELVALLEECQEETQARDLVEHKYPSVYVSFLEHHKLFSALRKYISFCEEFRDVSPEEYLIYCFGFISPTIQNKHDKDLLFWGKYTETVTLEQTRVRTIYKESQQIRLQQFSFSMDIKKRLQIRNMALDSCSSITWINL